jgi:2-octaprenylphenol hydroxylase
VNSTTQHYDVIINGGGMVGATLACLIAKQGRKVAVIEASEIAEFSPDRAYDLRVSAISRASQNAFIEIGAWDAMLAMRASPYEIMDVWDAAGDGHVRFDAAELGEPDLGHIIENNVVQAAVSQALASYSSATLYQPAKLKSFDADKDKIEVTLESGEQLSADLLVGADGANSKVRSLAGIDVSVDDYAQRGLVAVVKTQKPHEFTAWQRFQSTGPLAFLPLSDGSCSIVWTLPSDRADYYLSLNKTDFKVALAEALDHKLGKITKVGERAAFPLKGSQAKPYVLERIALVGDAAHTIHPLAGQGVNLGIKDAVELAQQLSSAQDLGSLKTLRRYERDRRGDNVLTMRAMEAFRLLFGHSATPVKTLRNIGMKIFNQAPIVKNEVIKRAMGL